MGLRDDQRDLLREEILSWKGTPYHARSRFKGPRGGVDCGQILAGVFMNLGFVPKDAVLPKGYSVSVHKHKHDTRYIETIERFMREIPEAEAKTGDVVVYKLELAFAHAAFVIEWPTRCVHAWAKFGVTEAHGIDHPNLHGKERQFYTLKEEFCEEHIDASVTLTGVTGEVFSSMHEGK